MRTISNKNYADKTTDYLSSIIGEKEKNNNHTSTTENYKNKQKYDEHVRKDVEKSLSTLTSTFPKPAPRTRVPSASVTQPPLAHQETYENVQQLMNGKGAVDNKPTGVGIGARSLDEFYRMQIQQHQSLYHRVTADDAAVVLASGYSTGGGEISAGSGGGVLHHRQQQQQQQQQQQRQPQQSIEMTRFEFEVTAGKGNGAGDSYQKQQKYHQQNIVGRYNKTGIGSLDDGKDGDSDDGGGRMKPMSSMTGTIGRRHRGGQQVLNGGNTIATVNHYYNNNHQYHNHQHGTRRRGNAAASEVGGDDGASISAQSMSASVNNCNNYNTVSGDGVSYYESDVYASMGTRQPLSKRQQSRPYCSGAAVSDSNVSDEQTLIAKRSWRRQPNRRRRAGVGGGAIAVEPGCDIDQEPPPHLASSDYIIDTVTGSMVVTDDPVPDRYRNVTNVTSVAASAATTTSTATNNTTMAQLEHHHRPRQKNDLRSNPPSSLSSGATSSAELQANSNSGGNINAIQTAGGEWLRGRR